MLTAMQIVHEIELLPPIERIKIIDTVIEDIFPPDPEVEKMWVDEAIRRLDLYQQNILEAVPYETVLAKFKRS